MKNRNALRGGAYSITISAVVLAILVVVNTFASALPANLTRYDISASKLYSITSNTKVVVNALEQDVTIYWVVQSGAEDAVIENLLSKYDSLSDHIQVVKKNPDVYPTFTQLYILEGHGEQELPASFREQIEKENIEVHTLSLLTVDEVPEDADCVMIYAPSSDISQEERDLLADYTAEDGKLFVAAGPVEEGILENLYSLLADYGVTANKGIVVESDRSYYNGLLRLGPLAPLPDLHSSPITDPLMEENYRPTMPVSLGLTVYGDSDMVTQLLTTSDTAFSKLDGYSLSTYEKEEGDIDGPFALAVSIETAGEGQIVWFTSSQFLEDAYNAASSGANSNLGMNALSSLIGETEAMAIRSKSLNYNYLTINSSTASLLKAMMIGIFPLAYLGIGIWVVLRRRRLQNEPV